MEDTETLFVKEEIIVDVDGPDYIDISLVDLPGIV